MDWTQTFTIITTLLGVTAWLDYKHRQEIDKMDERWQWLFQWAHQEIDQIKGQR